MVVTIVSVRRIVIVLGLMIVRQGLGEIAMVVIVMCFITILLIAMKME